ncbi:MAG: GGDEF domain-containing protein [Minwuia sp.]|uniref:GGDEF domain-containing protein n=1 Tax=Minwuia sp. TaxID=2493630 RepID=UPI003A8B5C80
MKIGGYSNIQSSRPAAPARGRTAAAVSDSSSGSAAREINDTAEVAGIPAHELTPKVRDAIMSLMAEVESLRSQLHDAQRRTEEAEKVADQDPLTPVSNRRAFVRDLSRMISYSERYGVPASLIFFDVNGMKQINDTHGHKAGDDALLTVADKLVANTRDSDVVGRLGGDEFAVVLAQADEKAAMMKAEELVEAIQSEPVVVNGETVPISVAYGIFPFRPGEDASSTLAEADRRMYERKRRMKADAA